MYRMLVDEIRDAVADGDSYNFIHYLFISRVHRLTHEEEAMVAAQCNSKRYKLAGTSALGSGDDVYPDSHDSPVRSFDTLRRSHVNCSSSHTTLLHWNQIACELRLIANECSGSGHHSSVAHTYDAKVPNTRRRTNITIVTCEGARVRVVRVRRKREVREQQNGHITPDVP
ncbi:hypothetical protein PISMIDRAFT_578443 [Pisolithus microcarpus 441]|uniref:Uncharacterized protein n=1 Tax=Pisolithus microcarpus 441 TaxID=765257 RepID=A0A0C9Z325_9AGAM|nr:hypothetical protein BKA83DRAFT_578443 [Pisolithus microcarpus]KIK20599.1 hypothetical protein PISMIDRAFT_578443 [Pisolithus microcarpus 441]